MAITDQVRQHRYVARNCRGRDFAVGDLHGEEARLQALLQEHRFNPELDRLFALGDLIDRGPGSGSLLALLREPWFFSVLGNHELMLLEGMSDPAIAALHHSNGGDWFYRLSPAERRDFCDLALEHLVLAFTIETGSGPAGLIHATAPADWQDIQHGHLSSERWHEYVWNRSDYNLARRDPTRLAPVRGVNLVVHGHVSCETPCQSANRLWIDTLYRGGGLTLISL